MDASVLVPACPHCGSTEAFSELDLVPGRALFTPVLLADGTVDLQFHGDTEMDWDDQRPASDPPEFLCHACDSTFTVFARLSR